MPCTTCQSGISLLFFSSLDISSQQQPQLAVSSRVWVYNLHQDLCCCFSVAAFKAHCNDSVIQLLLCWCCSHILQAKAEPTHLCPSTTGTVTRILEPKSVWFSSSFHFPFSFSFPFSSSPLPSPPLPLPPLPAFAFALALAFAFFCYKLSTCVRQ